MSVQLYPGMPFSPQAVLQNNIGAADTVIEVSDISAFPPAPNLATIGTDEEGETIAYAAKTDTALSGCVRGVEGTAKTWAKGEPIGRNWTAKDHNDLISAVLAVKDAVEEKQDTLTGRPGQVVGFGADGAAEAVQGWSGRNLLINSDFQNPVNRNGKRKYVTAGNTIDMWTITGTESSLTLEDDGICFIPSASSNGGRQYIRNPSALAGRTVTMSILVGAENGTSVRCGCNDGALHYSDFVSSGIAEVTVSINENVEELFVFFQCDKAAKSPSIKAVKLELGGHQTLAHQDEAGNWVLNDPPDYAMQYALCSLYSPITGDFVGSRYSNDNLLDNWYFADPVNQRGQTEYGRGGTIDLWRINGSSNTGLSVQLTSDGIVFKKSVANVYGSFCQRLENPGWLTGNTVTFSMLAKGNTDPYLLIYFNGETSGTGITSIPLTDDWNLYTVTRVMTRSNMTAIQISIGYQTADPVGDTIIRAAKLELGPKQTLAHQDEAGNWVLNDPPPNKALELLKCQRYQYKNTNGATEFIRAARITPNTIYFDLPIPTPMRATPTIVNPDSLSVYSVVQNAGSDTAVPGFTFAASLLGGTTLRIQASKTAHGLSDAALFATSTLFDANL